MKDIKTYLNEGKQIDDQLATEIVKTVIDDNKLDKQKIIKELEKYDYDIETILYRIETPSKKPHNLETISELINTIWNYLEENYGKNASEYYTYIINNIDKYVY